MTFYRLLYIGSMSETDVNAMSSQAKMYEGLLGSVPTSAATNSESGVPVVDVVSVTIITSFSSLNSSPFSISFHYHST